MRLCFVLSARIWISVMSEAVGVCIVSCGELYAAADTARFELCLKVIGAKLDTNSLNNGCDFPTSSQVSQKVLLPFFKKKYSVHLLIGIFHGDNDGLWMLGGQAVENHAVSSSESELKSMIHIHLWYWYMSCGQSFLDFDLSDLQEIHSWAIRILQEFGKLLSLVPAAIWPSSLTAAIQDGGHLGPSFVVKGSRNWLIMFPY